MSRLDGNNRWSGKMLMTEHQQQYDNRNDFQTGQGQVGATVEELRFLRDFIILPQMIGMIQKSIAETSQLKITLRAVMVRCMEYVMSRVTDDYYILKKELDGRNIRLLEGAGEVSEDICQYKYLCRGYEHQFGITREVLKSEIGLRLTAYIREIGSNLKKEK